MRIKLAIEVITVDNEIVYFPNQNLGQAGANALQEAARVRQQGLNLPVVATVVAQSLFLQRRPLPPSSHLLHTCPLFETTKLPLISVKGSTVKPIKNCKTLEATAKSSHYTPFPFN